MIRCSSSVTIKEAYNSEVTSSENDTEFPKATMEESNVPRPHYAKKVAVDSGGGTVLYLLPSGEDP